MVKICPQEYVPTTSDEVVLTLSFEKYPFPLSSFQKYAIEAIVTGNHILVTAHTGSGKTLPAEFAIEYFALNKGQKVIYTAPIKALSNQKFYEFTRKFPDISFGILTGDIKMNPEASVLIMTTEILLNALYNNSVYQFNLDQIGCVIFDEVHYINDASRGRVWEETMMLLPSRIQMVMLSATLDAPETFAEWCESGRRSSEPSDKIVYLTTTLERVVPLTHYSYLTCTQGLFKTLNDKDLEASLKKQLHCLHVIQDSKGNMNDAGLNTVYSTLKLMEDKRHYVKRQHVLNSVAKYMYDNDMLPAICFVLSRKALEQCAQEMSLSMVEDDSKVPYTVRRECEQIIRKLPNYKEYLELPEYNMLVSLLEKGIAIHHAGMMPVLREMVELLFLKGFIKLLFATETFALGINVPIKTVVFTDLNKYNGSTVRPLLPHEYGQMVGRAGRRGIDTVGYIIHLTNLFKDNLDQTTLRTVMTGGAQTLKSKFKLSYHLLLNALQTNKDLVQYSKQSMLQKDIEKETRGIQRCMNQVQEQVDELAKELDSQYAPVVPRKAIEEYIEVSNLKKMSTNKKAQTTVEKRIKGLKDLHPNIGKCAEVYRKYQSKLAELNNLATELDQAHHWFEHMTSKVLKLLEENGFLNTTKGVIASHLREVHCLIFAQLIEDKVLHSLHAKELVSIFSCFTNIALPEEKRAVNPDARNLPKEVITLAKHLDSEYKRQYDIELAYHIDSGIDYDVHFDLMVECLEWCDSTSESDCKMILQRLVQEKEIYLGEFVKALLKINNIASEMEKVAELIGDMELLSKLRQIPHLTLKFVATNQSLYI